MTTGGADRQLKTSTEGLEGLDLRSGDPAPKVRRRETGMEERDRWGGEGTGVEGRDRWGGRKRWGGRHT